MSSLKYSFRDRTELFLQEEHLFVLFANDILSQIFDDGKGIISQRKK